MIKFIGDLSSSDAEVLREYALISSSILEFGSGGSTQILSYYSNHRIISVDTEPRWIEKTKANIDLFGIKNVPLFFTYTGFKPGGLYDFIFVDGLFKLRGDFAVNTWKHLKVGGVVAFHDTRRITDVRNVHRLIETYFTEVNNVAFNYKHSNITIVEKKAPEPYVNWQL